MALGLLAACASESRSNDVEESEDAFTLPGDGPSIDPRELPPPAATPRVLRYYVIPHADDEMESWSILERDPDHYPVFMLMTRGEQTQYCGGKGFAPNTGERLPQPQPFADRFTETCAKERIDAWSFFLDEMSKNGRAHTGSVKHVGKFTGEVRAGDVTPTRCDDLDDKTKNCHVSRDFEVWVGERSARVVFDLGDGDLSKEEVEWAIHTVQRRRDLFPIQEEDDIVAAGYANKNPLFGLPYAHGDHLAIHHAIYETDFGTPGPQWGRTALGDPDAAVTLWVSGYAFDAMFHVDGNRRVGAHAVAYGWLADPYYEGCERALSSPFSHEQKFWRRF